MIDTTTAKPLSVSAPDPVRPYIIVPLAQLETVQALLDTNKVSYRTDEESLSVDGKPAVIFINLAYGTDPRRVQRLLDSIS